MRYLWAVIALLAIAPASADAAPSPDEVAEEHLTRGVALRRQGLTERALAEFRKAHTVSPSARSLAQMGLAEQALKRWVDAEQHLAEALDDPNPWVQKNRSALESSLETVRDHVGELMVQGPTGARVTVNGRDAGVVPLRGPVRVSAGEASLVVTAPGHREFSRWVTVRGRGSETIVVTLTPVAAPAPAAAAPPLSQPSSPTRDTERWTGRQLAGAGLLVAGVAGVAIGATLFILDGNQSCTPRPGLSCEGERASKAPALILGGAGVAAGVAGWVLIRDRRTGTQVGVSAGLGGATLWGRF